MIAFTLQDGIIVQPAPIYERDLKQFKTDSRRALKQYKRRNGKWINTFLNSFTIYTPLLVTALPLAASLHA